MKRKIAKGVLAQNAKRTTSPSVSEKLRSAQSLSVTVRKVDVTMKKAPWEKDKEK